jgi:hypothetical protein
VRLTGANLSKANADGEERMLTDEEYDIIADKYFAKIKRIGDSLMLTNDIDIPTKVREMNGILERIKEIRTIQRRRKNARAKV